MKKQFLIPYPWTFTVGVARSGIAAATLVTLAATPTESLFRPLRGGFEAPSCDGVNAIGLFCVSGSGGRELAKWLAVGLLLLAASGWRPRFTALPHWWITFSVFSGIAIPDGGDQIAAVVTAALLPYCLLDSRRWHWSQKEVPVPGWSAVVAASALVAIKVQMSFLYFQAAVAKLPHPEWTDGTAIYYYIHAPNLGAPTWLGGVLDVVFASGTVVALLIWLPLAIETTLALTLLTRRAARRWLLGLGIAFHGAIAFTMGLWSFSIIMVCCLLIFTIPVGNELRWSRRHVDAHVDTEEEDRPAGEPVAALR